ncbi:MAG TPA: Ku protein [Gammaproteobacteria bacterium]|nr:Ku protein [Gammaproteobacteria bacterium]
MPAEHKKTGRRRSAGKPERDAGAQHDHAPGPRAFWSGTITFGLVSVPVDLFPAVRSRRAPLRMFGASGEPLARRYVCSADGKPLAYEDIVRGYEWPDGSFTVVSDEELDALAPRKSRDIDLRRFVARDEIPPELLERSYLLAPAGDSTKAYHLLAAAMERGGRAGIATFVMRGKEYLAAIFAEGGLLRAVTMRFADELRSPQDVGLPEVPRVAAEQRKRVAAALAKLEAEDVDTAELEDDYTAALLALAEKKRAAGRDVIEIAEAPAEDEEGTADVIDIMSVLKQRMGEPRGPARAQPARQPQRADELEASSKKELYERAQALGIPNRSRMSRDELIAALRDKGERAAS